MHLPLRDSKRTVPIIVRGITTGLVVCQALCSTKPNRSDQRVMNLGLPRTAVTRTRSQLCQLSKAKFDHTVQFIGLIVDHLCQHVDNDLTQAELEQTTRAVAAHEVAETRLREELNHVLPWVHEKADGLNREGHSRQRMCEAVAYMHANIQRPIHLRDVAEKLGLNASYFSSLFTCHMGIPFAAYLRELRIEKAQELLHDHHQRIADVAYAVGFKGVNVSWGFSQDVSYHITVRSPRKPRTAK